MAVINYKQILKVTGLAAPNFLFRLTRTMDGEGLWGCVARMALLREPT